MSQSAQVITKHRTAPHKCPKCGKDTYSCDYIKEHHKAGKGATLNFACGLPRHEHSTKGTNRWCLACWDEKNHRRMWINGRCVFKRAKKEVM